MSNELGATTLAKGDRIAWTERMFGRTSGISAIHRVYQDGRTYCLLEIPDEAKRHFDLTLAALPTCDRCERLFNNNASWSEIIAA